MEYLIDTHTLIWAITDTEKLSKKAKKILESEENTIYVSSVCFWEISLKFSIGKLELSGMVPSDFPKLAEALGFDFISLSAEDAASYHHLTSSHHKDPFDRMLIWQAIQHKLIIVTKDQKFENYSDQGLKVVW
jgi:PIN domain nuclease of toxin-antitoxin system